MKKIILLAIAILFAMLHSNAQVEYSVKAGLSNCFNKTISGFNDYVVGDHYGFEVKVPLRVDNMFISFGYDMHGYSSDLGIQLASDENEGGFRRFTLQETYRSVPILVNYRLGAVDFSLGYEPMLLHTMLSFTGSNGGNYQNTYRLKSEFVFGTEIAFSNSFALSTKLYMADLLFRETFESSYGEPFKTRREAIWDVSLKYYIKRNRN